MTEIKTHPELNRLALFHNIDASYVLWLALRDAAMVSNLSSHFTRTEAFIQAQKYGLSYSRRTFNRILIEGGGLFWGTDENKIYLRSFKWVYNRLADEEAARIPQSMYVPLRIATSAAERRAELYFSWFIGKEDITIARDTLCGLFGLSHDRQRHYESLLGDRLIIKTNYCHIDADLYKEQLENIPTYSYSFLQEKFTDNRVELVNVIVYQVPNTFIASIAACGESPLSYAPNRAVRVSRTLYGLTTARSYNERCYFYYYDQWEKSMSANAYIRTYYQGKKRIWRMGQFL